MNEAPEQHGSGGAAIALAFTVMTFHYCLLLYLLKHLVHIKLREKKKKGKISWQCSIKLLINFVYKQ